VSFTPKQIKKRWVGSTGPAVVRMHMIGFADRMSLLPLPAHERRPLLTAAALPEFVAQPIPSLVQPTVERLRELFRERIAYSLTVLRILLGPSSEHMKRLKQYDISVKSQAVLFRYNNLDTI
jgi:hypothetical protein